MTQFTAIVVGRVQMVMYRDFVQRKARGLGLVGTVQNLKDCSVQVIAQGERELLERLIGYLHRGSFLSHVENVEVKWDNPLLKFVDFTIVYG